MAFQAGDIVGEYRILGPIASGGMGEVFRAEHVLTKRVEAIKILHSGGLGTEEQTQRFLREIQLQASLTHPNIAAVYNAFRLGDDLVMVMELVEGEPLRALMARRRLDLPAAFHYAHQVLQAIAYAHANGVIHRDISPSNIIITGDGNVKLTDFGLAKAPAAPSASQSGAPMGSPWYMSPEQVKDASQASACSDIYSLGAVFYEMVTGRKLFEGDNSFSIMQAQVETAPVPPSTVEPGLSPALNAAILTALEKDPSRRFASADAFRSALEQAAKPMAILRPPKRRNLWDSPVLQFTVTCGSILLVLFVATHRRMVEPRVPRPPVARETQALPEVPPETPVEARQTVAGDAVPEKPAPAPVPLVRRPRRQAKARGLAPRVVGEEPVAPPPRLAEARRAPDPVPPPAPAPPQRVESQPEVQHAATPASEVAAPVPAPTDKGKTNENEKKPRNRLWRALGRILPHH